MATKKKPGFGPVQLADFAGLNRWQVEWAQTKGLVPAPAGKDGRWTDVQGEDVKERRAQIVEAIGSHQGFGAKRAAELLSEALGLDDLALWSADVEQLVERGLLEETSEYKGWPLYDTRTLTSPGPEIGTALREIVAERVAWWESSATADAAAGRCQMTVEDFRQAAREKGFEAGRFERWALRDVERVAGVEDLDDAAVAAARMLGPDEAAAHLGIRRREFDYCVEAGWLAPVSTIKRTVWHGSRRGYAKTVDVPLYRLGDLDQVLQIEDVDWEKVRQLKPRQVSPLRRFAQQAPKRADAVRAFAARLRSEYDVVAWTHYANLDNRWWIDWQPREDNTPTKEDVAALLADDAGLAPYADTVRLLTSTGRTVHWARRMLQPGVAVAVDTETHDLFGSVMEVAVVDCATGEVLLDTLVNPEVPVTSGAFAVHGISDAMVADAPTWDQVLPDLLRVTKGRTILAYNSEYDRTVVLADCRRTEQDPQHLRPSKSWECIMQARSVWEGAWEYEGLGGGHRALGDTIAALDVLRELTAAPPWAQARSEKATEKVSA